jgi:chromosome segregation ATPase
MLQRSEEFDMQKKMDVIAKQQERIQQLQDSLSHSEEYNSSLESEIIRLREELQTLNASNHTDIDLQMSYETSLRNVGDQIPDLRKSGRQSTEASAKQTDEVNRLVTLMRYQIRSLQRSMKDRERAEHTYEAIGGKEREKRVLDLKKLKKETRKRYVSSWTHKCALQEKTKANDVRYRQLLRTTEKLKSEVESSECDKAERLISEIKALEDQRSALQKKNSMVESQIDGLSSDAESLRCRYQAKLERSLRTFSEEGTQTDTVEPSDHADVHDSI